LFVASTSYDAVVAGLMLNFVPQPSEAVAEMARAARPGGMVAAYVWAYAGNMQLMRHFWNAVVAFDRAAIELDEGRRFPLCQPELLTPRLSRRGTPGGGRARHRYRHELPRL
jgi:SAM-dependent methyltransferase